MRSPAPHIPDEIILNILPRLPVKSLLQFKCVSKLWNSLISDPTFALSNEPQRKKAIVCSSENKSITSFHSINSEIAREELHFPLLGKNSCICRFLGACHGLLLLSFDADVFLWNPSTRKNAKVLEMKELVCDWHNVVPGFCYDESDNDYIAVIGLFNRFGPSKVVVASLKKKIWNEIAFPYDLGSACVGPVVNERLHWLVRDKNHDLDEDEYMDPNYAAYLYLVLSRGRIIYFDAQSREFKSLAIPDEDPDNLPEERAIACLGVSEDRLCMVDSMKVMVMEDYGVKESWRTLFVKPSTLHDLRMICSVKNEQVLMVSSKEILMYDHDEDEEWSLWTVRRDKRFEAAATICESLVSPSEYRFE